MNERQREYQHEHFLSLTIILILSSISPLFLLWALKETTAVSQTAWSIFCISLFVVPNAVLIIRWKIAVKSGDRKTIRVTRSVDHRDHLITYLFALLSPMFTTEMKTMEQVIANLLIVFFIFVLFWNMNLHYLNFFFALKGYRAFTVTTIAVDERAQREIYALHVVLTRQPLVVDNEQLSCYRLSDTVLVDR